MHFSSFFYIVFFCLRPSWKIDISNEQPLKISSLLLHVL